MFAPTGIIHLSIFLFDSGRRKNDGNKNRRNYFHFFLRTGDSVTLEGAKIGKRKRSVINVLELANNRTKIVNQAAEHFLVFYPNDNSINKMIISHRNLLIRFNSYQNIYMKKFNQNLFLQVGSICKYRNLNDVEKKTIKKILCIGRKIYIKERQKLIR